MTTIAPGDCLPDLALTRTDGSAVRAADYAGQKLVLFFYPKDDTPGCTTENIDFRRLPMISPRLVRLCWGSARIRRRSMRSSLPSTA